MRWRRWWWWWKGKEMKVKMKDRHRRSGLVRLALGRVIPRCDACLPGSVPRGTTWFSLSPLASYLSPQEFGICLELSLHHVRCNQRHWFFPSLLRCDFFYFFLSFKWLFSFNTIHTLNYNGRKIFHIHYQYVIRFEYEIIVLQFKDSFNWVRSTKGFLNF